jgi:NAD+ synthase (glutamine-hydrolysing)
MATVLNKNLNKEFEFIDQGAQGNIALAQINPISGYVESNAKKVMKYIKKAEEIGVDLVVFSELVLMAYPIMDTIDRHPVIVKENVKWLKEIAKQTNKTHAIIGFVEPRNGEKFGKRYYNAVAVLGEGKIKAIVRKSLLPTYSEFNDYRYFEPSPVVGCQPADSLGNFGTDKIVKTNGLIEINGFKYAIVICEDGWNDKDFFANPMYEVDPVEKLAKEKPDVIINCSSSPTRTKKEQLKHNMFSFVAKKYNIPIVYVNQVGATDDISFDGSSRVYDKNGELISRAKSFEEQLTVANPIKSQGHIYPLTKGLEKTLTAQKVFSLDYEPDLERTYKTIIQGIRDYYKKNSLKRAVLGLSGGLDSSVSAVLLADALGAENVFGVSMPSEITSRESNEDARLLADNLGIKYAVAPIKEMVNTINEQLEPLFKTVETQWNGNRYETSYVQDNVQARSRATLLWGISNEFSATIPIATSDKSELYMGYATINGDMSGGFAPIADVPKTKLFALARWLNKNRVKKNSIPETIILKPPGAELAINPKTGLPLKAEEALMPYEFLDEVIWRIENKHESYQDMVDDIFIYEKKNKITQEQKKEWLDKFYKRMAGALYKWSIIPPSVIVEGRSINKNDYKQPITSGKIDYKGQAVEKIAEKLRKVYLFKVDNTDRT